MISKLIQKNNISLFEQELNKFLKDKKEDQIKFVQYLRELPQDRPIYSVLIIYNEE